MDVLTLVENDPVPREAVKQKCIVRFDDSGMMSILLFDGSGPNGFRILSPARCSLRSVAIDTVSVRTRRNRRVCGEDNLLADCVRIGPAPSSGAADQSDNAWPSVLPQLIEKWAMQQRYACARAKHIASQERPRSAEPRNRTALKAASGGKEQFRADLAKATAVSSDLSALHRRGQPLWPLVPMEIARANGLWSGRRASCPGLFECVASSSARDLSGTGHLLHGNPRLAAWAKGVTKTGRQGLSRREYKKQLKLIGAHNVSAALSTSEPVPSIESAPPSPQAAASPTAVARMRSKRAEAGDGMVLLDSPKAASRTSGKDAAARAAEETKKRPARVERHVSDASWGLEHPAGGSPRAAARDPVGAASRGNSDEAHAAQPVPVQAAHGQAMYPGSMMYPSGVPGMVWVPMTMAMPMPMPAPAPAPASQRPGQHGVSHVVGSQNLPPRLIIQQPVMLPTWDDAVAKQCLDASTGLWSPLSYATAGGASMMSPRMAQAGGMPMYAAAPAAMMSPDGSMVMSAGLISPTSAAMSQLSPSSGYTLWAAAGANGQPVLSPTASHMTGLGYMQSAQTVTGQTFIVNTAAAVPLQSLPAALTASMPVVYTQGQPYQAKR